MTKVPASPREPLRVLVRACSFLPCRNNAHWRLDVGGATYYICQCCADRFNDGTLGAVLVNASAAGAALEQGATYSYELRPYVGVRINHDPSD